MFKTKHGTEIDAQWIRNVFANGDHLEEKDDHPGPAGAQAAFKAILSRNKERPEGVSLQAHADTIKAAIMGAVGLESWPAK